MDHVEAVRARLDELDFLRDVFSGVGELTVASPPGDEAALRGWVESGGDGEPPPWPGLPPLVVEVALRDVGLLCTVAYTNAHCHWGAPARVAARGLDRSLPSATQQALTAGLAQLVPTLSPGEPCVWAVVMWLRETPLGGRGPAGIAAVEVGATEVPPPPPARLERRWLLFIGFYTRSIIDDFVGTAGATLTGFLMSGKVRCGLRRLPLPLARALRGRVRCCRRPACVCACVCACACVCGVCVRACV